MIQLILATWRLTSLLHREDGPKHLLSQLRYRLGVRYDERSQPCATTNVAEGLLCFWCSSVWASAAICMFAALLGLLRWRDVPLSILAASTGAIVLEEFV